MSAKLQLNNDISDFGIEELFISTTDKKGKILSANDVFVRVSEYSKDQLINSPHNIIRHPDMPKAVFKLLWDTINKNETICAYVKNRSNEGKYYWVFATVIPIEIGYISIRFKPSTKYLKIVEDLYSKVLKEENNSNLDKGIEKIVNAIKGLGFSSYKEFMIHALSEELKSRDTLIGDKEKNINSLVNAYSSGKLLNSFTSMNSICSTGAKDFVNSYNNLEKFNNIKYQFEEITKTILKSCHKLEYLSLNMSVTANKLGKEGASLAIVSTSFQRAAKEIVERFQIFSKKVEEIINILSETRFSLSVARVQTEMLAFYTNEIIQYLGIHDNEININNKKQIINDTTIYINAVKKTFDEVTTKQKDALQILKQFKSITTMLKNIILSLDLIRMGGKLEGARTDTTEEAFKPYIEEMLNFIKSVDDPVGEVASVSNEMIEVFEHLHEELETISTQFLELDMIKHRVSDYSSNETKEKLWIRN